MQFLKFLNSVRFLIGMASKSEVITIRINLYTESSGLVAVGRAACTYAIPTGFVMPV